MLLSLFIYFKKIFARYPYHPICLLEANCKYVLCVCTRETREGDMFDPI